MKKEIVLHFIYAFVFFVLLSLIRGLFDLHYWPLWLGAIVGTILPNVDHLVYAYFLKPEELISQRITYLNQERNYPKAMEIMAESRYDRSGYVLHTAPFQVIFLVLTFLVTYSSSSLLGRGLVLAFSLHLLVDQFQDLMTTGELRRWFANTAIPLDVKSSKIYFSVMTFVFLLLAFVL
jgi:hypothetical protein